MAVTTPAGTNAGITQQTLDEAATASAASIGQKIFRWTVPMVPGAARPLELQEAIDGMRFTTDPRLVDFVDRVGRGVRVPRIKTADGMDTDRSVVPFGVAEVLWDFLLGRIALGEDRPDRDPQLYVRDYNRAGDPLPGWHRIATLQMEYNIDRKDMLAGLDTIIIRMLETSDRPRVRRGIRFANVVFTRRDGRVVRLHRGDQGYDDPMEITFPEAFDDKLADESDRLIGLMCADDGSAENLTRWFATPLLEPHKELSYIIYGGGGNGKGTLLRGIESNPTTRPLYEPVDLNIMLHPSGGFTQESATLRIMGKLWVADEDAPELTIKDMDKLKKWSTGDTATGRGIGQNAVTFHIEATPAIMTNENVAIPPNQAGDRRFSFVRTRDNRPKAELDELNAFIDRYTCVPFMMASCRVWEQHGDRPRRVRLGDASQLTQREEIIVQAIARTGYAITGALPACSQAEHRNSMAKLGLKSAKRRLVTQPGGKPEPVRVLVVDDQSRFAPYAEADAVADRDAEAVEAQNEACADRIYALLDDVDRPEGMTVHELARVIYPDENILDVAERRVWQGLAVLGTRVRDTRDAVGTVRFTLV
ncbi:hypothetical protein H6A68_02770 [Bifidobacterium pullorum subsp. saeculare]|uniref:DUF5906 domain-containing protein n=1 Tax=Bifidobacterium pullorum TaxID=78448 RepID=UPI00195BBD26|nr:DUF5906 domain-containing protein [Bifidobacterium pullorum]MBM6705986.1 hypothetical protein [Bifidobacterium pullorum subsp. saeculare]